MTNFFCEHCGMKFTSVANLTSGSCPRHPNGAGKGKHTLYQGAEKPQYTCKNCGMKFSSLSSLTSGMCPRHPNGAGKGKHEPAL